ncbi:HAD-IA family hydrolase [Entomomonas sp. E2T0]|uniref:HAD-IA family hydrolase n=1 Tax=Entomomonas sp. E2T0 TaxID=2930213 RepID=UPI0022284F6C|nr:HAD-IA family hydrolase [Entomomonas sp. E2T0]UYZ84672.1 HAD-IA family hydrolase [Entomomonas sp. E2T0]
MAKYKLAIFDWDGTLLDSINLIVNSIHVTAKDFGLPVLDNQSVKNIIGLRLDNAVSKLYPELSPKQLTEYLENYAKNFVEMEKTTPNLYPNVLETLQKLQQNDYLLAIATGKSRKGLDRILGALELTNFFDATRCADETAGKPNPKMLNELLDYFGLNNKQAVMVGDASFDLQMANNANMDSIAVSYGAQSVEALKSYSPLTIIDQFDELPKYLISH